MNRHFLICLFLYSCFGVSSCSTQGSDSETTQLRTFDLGKATVQLPATWRLLDTTQAHVSPHRGRDYILQNARSRHAGYREMLAIDFINTRGERSLTKMGHFYADYLKKAFDDVQINSIKDTTINGKVIQVMQCALTLKEPKMKLISTIAFAENRQQLVTIAGTAVRGPEIENLRNQSLFRHAVYSFAWK